MFPLSNALWDITGTLKHQRYFSVHSVFLKTLFVTLCCKAVIIWDKANICPHETFKCSWVISLLLSVSWCWFWQSHLLQKKVCSGMFSWLIITFHDQIYKIQQIWQIFLNMFSYKNPPSMFVPSVVAHFFLFSLQATTYLWATLSGGE